LRPFVATAKQNHNQGAVPGVVKPIAGTEVDPQFLDTAANGFAVSKVAQTDPIETGTHNPNRRASRNEAS
jgi:hypothetical protein